MTLAQEARALKALKQKYEKSKKATADLETEFKQAQTRLRDRLEAEGIESIKSAGTLFVPAETTYATIQDRAAFVEWANENDIELVELKERKEQLNALVRSRLDDGQPLPPGVGYYTREYVSQRAA